MPFYAIFGQFMPYYAIFGHFMPPGMAQKIYAGRKPTLVETDFAKKTYLQGRRHVFCVGSAGLHERAQNTKKVQSNPL